MGDLRKQIGALGPSQRRELADRLSMRGGPRLQAYVVPRSPGETPGGEDLKRYLTERLPSHAVPSAIIVLESFPRLPNGKIDRRALVAREDAEPDVSPSATPASLAEETLLGIWREVLGMDEISVHDDFFEIGGDSILAIQIVSRARAAGLALSPADLGDHPTVARLTARAGEGRSESRESGLAEIPSGPVPLTPIQSWFFDLRLAEPTHWNQAVVVELATEIDSASIRAAVRGLGERHPQLRAGFACREGRWIQEIGSDPPALEGVPLSEVASPDASEAFRTVVERLQGSFRFDGRPLFRFALVESENWRRLLILAHHLVVDHLSWSMLLEDLDRFLAAASAGQAIAAEEGRSIDFAVWARLVAENGAEAASSELDYWSAPVGAEFGRLPRDHEARGEWLEGDAERLRVELDPESSRRLFHETGAAYRTRVTDLLVTALGLTLMEITGRHRFRIGLERHGRDALGEAVDAARSVGWFTTYFPLRLSLPEADEVGPAIKAVKECLRSIPRSGIGFGQLRYGGDPDVVARVAADEEVEDVLFNYLGPMPSSFGTDSSIRAVTPIEHAARAAANRRSHLLEINAFRQGDLLCMDWAFNTRAHQRATIETWAALFLRELERLIDHCASGTALGHTPSDFPESGMSQGDLDRLLGQL